MKQFIFILATCFTLNSYAQTRSMGGFFPEASLSYKISENYSVTHKVESQHGLYDDQKWDDKFEYNHSLTDLQSFIGKRLSPFVKVDIGYQYRIEEGENTHRPIQQVSILQRSSMFRIGHRIRTDQTFFKNEKFLFRARYRLKSQIPLNGVSLDPGENYLAFSNEIIYMTQDGDDDIENRLAGALGFYIDDKNKFEIGLDYRTDDYLVDNRFRNRLWFKVGYYKSL